jgi:hypothetical protein
MTRLISIDKMTTNVSSLRFSGIMEAEKNNAGEYIHLRAVMHGLCTEANAVTEHKDHENHRDAVLHLYQYQSKRGIFQYFQLLPGQGASNAYKANVRQ